VNSVPQWRIWSGLNIFMIIDWVWFDEPRVSVLDCASPLALLQHKLGDAKRQGTGKTFEN
jgi:hypothetical protein